MCKRKVNFMRKSVNTTSPMKSSDVDVSLDLKMIDQSITLSVFELGQLLLFSQHFKVIFIDTDSEVKFISRLVGIRHTLFLLPFTVLKASIICNGNSYFTHTYLQTVQNNLLIVEPHTQV